MKNQAIRQVGVAVVLVLISIESLAQSSYEAYTFTTLAGGSGFISPDAPGGAVRFRNPGGVATDSLGNVYVSDTFNHAIRKVTPNGISDDAGRIARNFWQC